MNINSYTVRTFTKDLGLPKNLASDIIKYKRKHGQIVSFDELWNVEGMSRCVLEKIKDNSIIPVNKKTNRGKGGMSGSPDTKRKRRNQCRTSSKAAQKRRTFSLPRPVKHLRETMTRRNSCPLRGREMTLFPVSVYPSPSENEIIIRYRKDMTDSVRNVPLPSPFEIKNSLTLPKTDRRSVCVQTPDAFMRNKSYMEPRHAENAQHHFAAHTKTVTVSTGERNEDDTEALLSTRPLDGSNMTYNNKQFEAYLTPDNIQKLDNSYGLRRLPDKDRRASIRHWLSQISQTELMDIPNSTSIGDIREVTGPGTNSIQNTEKRNKGQDDIPKEKPRQETETAVTRVQPQLVESNRQRSGQTTHGVEIREFADALQLKVTEPQTRRTEVSTDVDNMVRIDTRSVQKEVLPSTTPQPGPSSGKPKDKSPTREDANQSTKTQQSKERNKERISRDSKERRRGEMRREKNQKHENDQNIRKDGHREHRLHRHRRSKDGNIQDKRSSHKKRHHKNEHRRKERDQRRDSESRTTKEETTEDKGGGACVVS